MGVFMKILHLTTDIKIRNALILLVGSCLFAIAMNMFIGPGGLYVGGLTGILQLLIKILDDLFKINLSLGILLFISNMPILWIALKSIGKRFAMLTIVVVVLQSALLEIMPIYSFSNDILLNTIFGGVLVGVGSGIILKIGASSGGIDVISQVISYKFNGSVGRYSFSINIFIIFIAGYYQSWEVAMYTIMAMYITSVLVDRVHTIHKNLTLYIVTQKEEMLTKAIWNELYRGITVLEASGAYTKEKRSVLMLVLSSYELYETLEIIKAVDPMVFINVVRSEKIVGNFVQKKIK